MSLRFCIKYRVIQCQLTPYTELLMSSISTFQYLHSQICCSALIFEVWPSELHFSLFLFLHMYYKSQQLLIFHWIRIKCISNIQETFRKLHSFKQLLTMVTVIKLIKRKSFFTRRKKEKISINAVLSYVQVICFCMKNLSATDL